MQILVFILEAQQSLPLLILQLAWGELQKDTYYFHRVTNHLILSSNDKHNCEGLPAASTSFAAMSRLISQYIFFPICLVVSHGTIVQWTLL